MITTFVISVLSFAFGYGMGRFWKWVNASRKPQHPGIQIPVSQAYDYDDGMPRHNQKDIGRMMDGHMPGDWL